MVVDDTPPNEENQKPEMSGQPSDLPERLTLEDRLATPQDRIAAAIADLVLISPVAALAMAPFKKIAQEALLQGHDDAYMLAMASAFGASALIIIAYQTLFLIKWRATPGKRLLGLTVESLWDAEGAPMKPGAAFLRACAVCVEALCLGLPWIGVIGNERRRPFHDRLADTIVLSKKKSVAGVPNLSERSIASGLMAAVFMALTVMAMVTLKQFDFTTAPKVLKAKATCDVVAKAESSWIPAVGETKPSKLSLALALYEAEGIDEECLKAEADASLWSTDADQKLAYLARGLAEKSDEELSQSYLEKACDESSDESSETASCQALVFLNAGDVPEDALEAKEARVERENELLLMVGSFNRETEPFLKILGVRELSQRGFHERALSLLETLSPQKSLAFFQTSERMKSQWALGDKSSVRASIKNSVASFDNEQRVSLSRWLCLSETSESGCSVSARNACDVLAASVLNDSVLLHDPDVAVGYLRGEACSNRLTDERLAEIEKETPEASTRAYVAALRENSKLHGQTPLLKTIAFGDDEGPFVNEARMKLVGLAQTDRELSGVREAWLDDDPASEGWMALGLALMTKYNGFHSWDQAIELGFKLGEHEMLNPVTAKPLVIASFRSGQTLMATGYLQTYFKPKTDNSALASLNEQVREPASVAANVSDDEFSSVVREVEADALAMRTRAVKGSMSTQGLPQGLTLKLPSKKKKATR